MGQNAIYYKGKAYTGGGGGGGSSTLVDLTDVNIDNPTNGQVLKWDATNEKWVNDDESGGSANTEEMTVAEYEQITPEQDEVYFVYSNTTSVLDPNYTYHQYGDIVVRVYHEGETDQEIVWFFNGFTKTASDWTIPSELLAYTPSSGSTTSKAYDSESSETQNGWIGWAVDALGRNVIRTWTTNWYYTLAGTFWAVVKIDGTNEQSNPYESPYVYIETGTPQRHIYLNGRDYGTGGGGGSTKIVDELWSGNEQPPTTGTSINLAHSISDYDLIAFSVNNTTAYESSLIVSVDELEIGKSYIQAGYYDTCAFFTYTSDTEILIMSAASSNRTNYTKIEGIKYGSESGGSSEVNYSTEEQRIGTWIDGKPLYQKTFIVDGTYQGRQTVDVSASIPTNIDLRHAEGQCTYQYGGVWYYYSLGTYFSYPWENINTFKVDIGSETVPVKAYITIRYTKTTD